jgi:hypothetical protein
MKLSLSISFTCLLCGIASAQPRQAAVQMIDAVPLRFEPSTDSSPQSFIARGSHYRFEFSRDAALLHTAQGDVRLQFDGVAPEARIEGEQKLRSRTNLFIGNDSALWRRDIPNYGQVRVQSLYRGVDLVYYGHAGDLEYDLKLKPGADARQIRLRLSGETASLDQEGNLVAGLIQKRPVAYQTAADGARILVASRYRRNRDGSYGFALGSYDHRRELVIDPVLTLSIYVGGSDQDVITAITHDSSGFLYVAGNTDSSDFPIVGNASQTTYGGNSDVFVAKIDPVGQDIVYSTYIGGSSNESLGGLAVDGQGNIYVGGTTASTNLPTVNPYQSAFGSGAISNAFVVWISPTGNLNYSTYLGGTGIDVAGKIALDSTGKVWMVGSTTSTNFPLVNPTQNGIYAGQDMFVAGVDPTQSGASSLVYSTYIGGEGYDIGLGIAVVPDGTLWIAGCTYSSKIELAGISYQPTNQGQGDAYVAHINPTLGANGVLYATFIGGSEQDEATNIVVDLQGRAIVTGFTVSSNFPVTNNAMQAQYGGNTDVFIGIIDTSQTSSRASELIYSTFFGGVNGDAPFDLKQDSNGVLYLSGYTLSPGLPATSTALQSAWDGSLDAFVLKFDPSGAESPVMAEDRRRINGSLLPAPASTGIDYFSYLGSDGVQVGYGVDFDSKGDIYLAGSTSGPIFDALGGVAKTSAAGNVDGFVAGFNSCSFATSIASYQFPDTSGTVTVEVDSQTGCSWTTSSTLNWITVTPGSGAGTGPVTITATANTTGAAQQGTITIAGVSFQVSQPE